LLKFFSLLFTDAGRVLSSHSNPLLNTTYVHNLSKFNTMIRFLGTIYVCRH